MGTRNTGSRTRTLALCALVFARVAPEAYGAPTSDRFGDGEALHAATEVEAEEALCWLGGHVLDRRGVEARQVTQTVFETLVQTATATTYTTVVSGSNSAVSTTDAPTTTASAPAQNGGSASTTSGDALVSSLLTDIVGGVTGILSDIVAPTPTSTPDAQPVLFMPPIVSNTQPALSTPTLLPSQDADSAHPSSPSPSPNTHSSAPPATQKPLMMAYYPDWTSASFPPEKVDFSRYDWVDFAFAVPLSDFSLGWDGSDDDPDVLKRLVAAAHQSGKKVKVSVGGWTGSKYFSSAVATGQSRQTFASNILKLYNQYSLDGIDIDWEFPGQAGNDGNVESPNDTANYLSFLQLLRNTLPPQAKITAATTTVPWADAQGNPLKDVSAFARVLDWILIMNYDTWGSSNPPGPNAPLSNACHNSTQSSASAVAGVATWTAAGFPASQIVLGLPSYGYISTSSASYLTTRSMPSPSRFLRARHVPMHLDGPEGDTFGIDALGDDPLLHAEGQAGAVTVVKNEDGGSADGQVQFRDLVSQGILQYIPAWSTTAAATRIASDDDGSGGQDSGAADDTDDPSSDDTGSTSDSDDTDSDDTDSDDTDSDDTDSDDTDSDDTDSGSDSDSDPSADPASPSDTLNTLSFAGHQISNVFTALQGFERKWDACSSTPYLRSAAAKQVVTYDDPQSLEMKATFVRYAGLLGVNMFDVHGDTDTWDLTDAARRGLGL